MIVSALQRIVLLDLTRSGTVSGRALRGEVILELAGLHVAHERVLLLHHMALFFALALGQRAQGKVRALRTLQLPCWQATEQVLERPCLHGLQVFVFL